MKIFEGIITSNGMQNTVVVEIARRTPHPLYRKLIRRSNKLKADTAGFDNLSVGDRVRIQETKPMSKTKYFKVIEIIGGNSKKEKIVKVKEEKLKVSEKPAVKKTAKTVKKTTVKKGAK